MELGVRPLTLFLGALILAGAAMISPARATPQFAVVGQGIADPPVQTENVTYYNRYGWGRGYNRRGYGYYPYRRYGYYPYRKYRYYSPNRRYGYYRRPYYGGYGFSYRGPNFYFRYGW